MAYCRVCGKDTGVRYLLDDPFCSPECAADDEYLTTTFHTLEDDFRQHQGEDQIELFPEEEPQSSASWSGLALMAFLAILLVAGAMGYIS